MTNVNKENIQKVIAYLEQLKQGRVQGVGKFAQYTFAFSQCEPFMPGTFKDVKGVIPLSVDGICTMFTIAENEDSSAPTTYGDHLTAVAQYLGIMFKQADEVFAPPQPMNWYTAEHAIAMLEHLQETGEVEWPRVEMPEDDPDFQYGLEALEAEIGEYDEDEDEDEEEL